MKPNIGATDKVIRIAAAIILSALVFTNGTTSILSIILIVFIGILLLTSFISFCPLYLPFGISTRKSNMIKTENTKFND